MPFSKTLSLVLFAWGLLIIRVCFWIPQKLIIKFTRHFFIRKDTKHSCYIFCSFQTGFYWANVHASCLLSTFQTFFTWRCMWWVVRGKKLHIISTYKSTDNSSKQLFIQIFNHKAVNKSEESYSNVLDRLLKIVAIFFIHFKIP